MRKLNLEQGSQEWLQWRKKLLTATDAPMLMGASPYVTPYKGWQRKLGLVEEQKSTAAMRRGTEDEPFARDLFILERGIHVSPCCIESENYNFIGASLDGISDNDEVAVEIKSQRPVQNIPKHHWMQMQHQILASDGRIKKMLYVSYWEGKNTIFEVEPDLEWQETYLEKAAEFWKGIVFFEAPPMTCKDYKDMSDSLEWNEYADQYSSVVKEIKALEDKKDYLRKELIRLCGDDSCCGHGLKVMKKTSKGRVDYSAIPEIQEIDLEPYRKKGSFSWTILMDKP